MASYLQRAPAERPKTQVAEATEGDSEDLTLGLLSKVTVELKTNFRSVHVRLLQIENKLIGFEKTTAVAK